MAQVILILGLVGLLILAAYLTLISNQSFETLLGGLVGFVIGGSSVHAGKKVLGTKEGNSNGEQ